MSEPRPEIAWVTEMIEVMRSKGVIRMRIDGYELELGPQPRADVGDIAPPTQAIGMEHGYPTADELLFASSPFPVTPEELKAQPPEKP